MRLAHSAMEELPPGRDELGVGGGANPVVGEVETLPVPRKMCRRTSSSTAWAAALSSSPAARCTSGKSNSRPITAATPASWRAGSLSRSRRPVTSSRTRSRQGQVRRPVPDRALLQRADGLDGHEGVPLAHPPHVRVQARQVVARRPGPRQRPHEAGDVRARQGRQGQRHRVGLPGQLAQDPSRQRGFRELLLARCATHQPRAIPARAGSRRRAAAGSSRRPSADPRGAAPGGAGPPAARRAGPRSRTGAGHCRWGRGSPGVATSGSNRLNSARQAGLSAATASSSGPTSPVRHASTHGPKGRIASLSWPRPISTRQSRSTASVARVASSRVLPTPASPVTIATCPRPWIASSRSPRSRPSSPPARRAGSPRRAARRAPAPPGAPAARDRARQAGCPRGRGGPPE